MARDTGDIAAGIAVTAPLGNYAPTSPSDRGYTPSAAARFFLDFIGTKSFYEYSSRAAQFYGVDLRTLEVGNVVGNEITKVKAPLLVVDSLDDALRLARIEQGTHFSLAYRALVKDNPYVHTWTLPRLCGQATTGPSMPRASSPAGPTRLSAWLRKGVFAQEVTLQQP